MAKKTFDIAAVLGAQVSESDTGKSQRVEMIPIDAIDRNAKNFYPIEDDQTDMMESIKVNGVLEPLLVLDIGTGYRLLSGHRRLSALDALNREELEGGGKQRFAEAPCMVVRRNLTEAEEDIILIESNRQRKKTPYILQQEAERLTNDYIQRKKEGLELSGKIRDRVAEQLELSRTHLARLAAIKNNLKVPGFERDFKEDRMSESVAYEVSKLSHDAQYGLLDYSIDRHQPVSLPLIKRYSTIYTMMGRNNCPHAKGLCQNADRMYDLFYRGGVFNCAGCCEKCLKKETCPGACQYIKKATPKSETAAHVVRNPALDDPRADWRHVRDSFCSRLTALRTSTGLSRKDFAESIDRYPNTYSAWENASLPGSEQMPVLALALGVSTDYLYGLTDDSAVSPAPTDTVPTWQPLARDTWPAEGQLCILARENELCGYQYQMARCVAGADDQYPFIDPNDDLTCEEFGEFELWIPLEEVKKI